MSAELKIARDAAAEAAEISRRYFRGQLDVDTKSDGSPVTEADRECELAIRGRIADAFPDHGFYGEETGKTNADADDLWLVDPIDGTKSFVREYPFFSTQIALMRNGSLALGVSAAPMFDETAWAERGEGAWLNGERLTISDIGSLSEATISTGNLKSLAATNGWAELAKLIDETNRIRGYGDFYHYHLLAAGKIDIVIESDVNILDIAALSVVVEEAGGVFTDLNGDPPDLETRSVLAATPALHGQVLERLKGFVR